MSRRAPGQDAVFESAGSYRTNITALGVRPGALRGGAGRLSFTGNDGRVYFDAPLQEFHSVGLAEMNSTLEVWQGPTRHRVALEAGGPIIGSIVGEFSSDTVAARWAHYLEPLVGPVPVGVKVKKPVSKAVQLTLTVLLSLIVVVLVFVGVLVFG